MVKHNIVLCGMDGNLQAEIGKALSQRLGMLYLDMDELIRYEFHSVRGQIPLSSTEYSLRLRDLCYRLTEYCNTVAFAPLSCQLQEENMEILHKNAYLILLYTAQTTLYIRLNTNEHKPIAQPHTQDQHGKITHQALSQQISTLKDMNVTYDYRLNTKSLVVEDLVDDILQYFKSIC